MSKPTTKDPTGDQLGMLLLKQVAESEQGFKFMMDLIKDKKSRVTLKLEIEVSRLPEKEK